MKCLLCLKPRKLIRAHVIPAWIFRFLYPDPKKRDGELVMVDAKNPRYVKRPSGIFDSKILCRDCDQEIGKLDSYARKVFFENGIVKHPSSKDAYIINAVDNYRIKLFFSSILWRASVSSREEFEKISLGSYEKSFRNYLLSKDSLDAVDLFIGKYDSKLIPNLANKIIMLPVRIRMQGGVNYYNVYLPKGLKAWVKVDKRKMPESLYNVSVSPTRNYIIIPKLKKYESSGEFAAFRQMVHKIPPPKSSAPQ